MTADEFIDVVIAPAVDGELPMVERIARDIYDRQEHIITSLAYRYVMITEQFDRRLAHIHDEDEYPCEGGPACAGKSAARVLLRDVDTSAKFARVSMREVMRVLAPLLSCSLSIPHRYQQAIDEARAVSYEKVCETYRLLAAERVNPG